MFASFRFSIYGTIRLKRKEANIQVEGSLQQLQRTDEDVDSLPPPPTDDGFEDARQPLLAAPKPAPRKGHSQDVLVSMFLAQNSSFILLNGFRY